VYCGTEMAISGAGGRLSIPGRLSFGVEVLVAYALTRRLLASGAPLRAAGPGPLAPVDGTRPPLSARAAARVAERARRVLRFTLRREPTCLALSLVVARLLRRRGTEARLVIGVTGAEDFTAHAWVEVDDQAVLPSGAGFHRLLEVDSA
jgi:hypothetical protein